jgi:23S rRNA (uracil1939-C5)-methyltransferase
MAHGGHGVARRGSGVIFVEGVLPGEVVNARVVLKNSRRTLAKPTDLIAPSPDRISPECSLFNECGGCQWQFIRYETQATLKERILADVLERLGGLKVPPLSPPLLGDPFGYRYRARLKVSRDGSPGFFAERSHRVVPARECPVLVEPLNLLLGKLSKYNELCRGLKEILIAWGGDGATAAAWGWGGNRINARSLMKKAGLKGLIINNRLIHGDPRVNLPMASLTCGISADGFFQANWELNLGMIEAVMELIPPGLEILDLYAGASNFSLPLAMRGDRVTAVEEHERPVEDARLCAVRHGLDLRFIQGDAEAVLSDEKCGAEAVLVDPPRAGMARGVTESLLRIAPSIVVYVSCDPATLARDLKRLGSDYRLVSVRLVDLFPQTSQIETIVKLERC